MATSIKAGRIDSSPLLCPACGAGTLVRNDEMEAARAAAATSSEKLFADLQVFVHRFEHVWRLVQEVAEPLGHVFRGDVLHLDLRFLGLGLELRIVDGLGKCLAQHG